MSAMHAPAPHSLGTHRHLEGDTCPYCEQTIPNGKLAEIEGRVEARERQRDAEIQARLREQFAREKREAELKARAELDAAKEQARLAAEAAVAERLSAAAAAKDSAEAQVQALAATQEALLKSREAELRQLLETERVAAVHAEQAKAFDINQKMQGKIAELQRQLENKTAQDLGDSAEVDLFEQLKAEFPEDRIARVEKGLAGADIVHDVHHNGRLCGRIVYDAKNRSAWRNEYVQKLRADQAEAKADHAILASKVFPSGAREMHNQDGVLVVAPGRVVILAGILRRHVVQTHGLRLSNEARAEKTEALYAFINSERFSNLCASLDTVADDLIEVDRKEEKAHQATWKRRADLIRAVQRAHGDLTREVEGIIGTRA